ncbi:hypothetical protein BD779DRAFT_1802551, partial [Infundibulicybe gibba]
MVRVLHKLLALASFFIVGLASPAPETTADRLIKDVQIIVKEATSLNTTAAYFHASSVTWEQVKHMHTIVVALDMSLRKGQSDAKVTPALSIEDSKNITIGISSFKSVVIDTANSVASWKSFVKQTPWREVECTRDARTTLKNKIDGFMGAVAKIATPRIHSSYKPGRPTSLPLLRLLLRYIQFK